MRHLAFLFLSLLCISVTSSAQDRVLEHGGGAYEFPRAACLTAEQREHIQADLSKQVAMLKELGLLHIDRSSVVQFELPIQGAEGLDWNNIYGISNFVDQTAGAGISDYNCGQRTYNGHLGTDYFTWPFGHYLKENDLAEVVAAAPGTIIQKLDGHFDEQCDLNSSLTWNAVYVGHSDGSTSWYGHLKEGSLTTKAIGETVEQGEYLGIVASSGFSSGPHLHFEVHDADNQVIDPYSGTCNSINSESWWTLQDDYTRMELNTVLTHSAVPEHGCPSAFENPYMETYFSNSDYVYLVPYYKDQDPDVIVTYSVIDPFDEVWGSWEHSSDQYYNSSWWYWSIPLPSFGGEGEWKFRVEFEGQTHERSFFLDNDPPVGLIESATDDMTIAPNPVQDVLYIITDERIDRWTILDMTGKVILSEASLNTKQIDTSHLRKGMYLLRTEMEGRMQHQPIIKE